MQRLFCTCVFQQVYPHNNLFKKQIRNISTTILWLQLSLFFILGKYTCLRDADKTKMQMYNVPDNSLWNGNFLCQIIKKFTAFSSKKKKKFTIIAKTDTLETCRNLYMHCKNKSAGQTNFTYTVFLYNKTSIFLAKCLNLNFLNFFSQFLFLFFFLSLFSF